MRSSFNRSLPSAHGASRGVRHRLQAVIHVVVLALLITGCGGLPTSGGVQMGNVTTSNAPTGPIFVANPPTGGESAMDLVRGFIAAGMGAEDNYSVARQYLTPQVRDSWSPGSQLIVYSSLIQPEIRQLDESTVTVTLNAVGRLDQAGRYASLPVDTSQLLQFTVRNESGQWRISEAPDGVAMSESLFHLIYVKSPIYFLNPLQTGLVPEVRWFPGVTVLRKSVEALLLGPSASATGVLSSAFPALKVTSNFAVNQTSSTVQVRFDEAFDNVNADTWAKIIAQMSATLSQVSSVNSLEVSVGANTVYQGTLQSATATTLKAASVDSAFVAANSENGMSLVTINGSSQEISAPLPCFQHQRVRMPALSADRLHAIALNNDRNQAMICDKSGKTWVWYTGKDLVAPALDSNRYAWVSPQTSDGTFAVTDIVSPLESDSPPFVVSAPYLAGKVVSGLSISPDATRVAVIVRDGSGTSVLVASIVRDANGVPIRLNSPMNIAANVSNVVSVSWASAWSLLMVGENNGTDQPVPMLVDVTGPKIVLNELKDISGVVGAQYVFDSIDGQSFPLAAEVPGKGMFSKYLGAWRLVAGNLYDVRSLGS